VVIIDAKNHCAARWYSSYVAVPLIEDERRNQCSIGYARATATGAGREVSRDQADSQGSQPHGNNSRWILLETTEQLVDSARNL
jgi:hypothetical protein